MQLLSKHKIELENKLSLLRDGESPEFRGPVWMHRVWRRQRQRKYEEELADTEHRISAWKDPKHPSCRGPTCRDIVLARFGGDAAFYAVIACSVVAFLHYVGLLEPLWWIVRNFVWILKSIVFFSNLHELVSVFQVSFFYLDIYSPLSVGSFLNPSRLPPFSTLCPISCLLISPWSVLTVSTTQLAIP